MANRRKIANKRLTCLGSSIEFLNTQLASKVIPSLAKNKLITLGFSLLELMFVLMIIGVLAAIAIPIYNGHKDKINNDKAIADIALMQTAIERYYTENFRYPPSLADLPAGSLPNNGLDPWGNPYVYLNIANGGPGIKGQVRKDHALNPINSLYDLYSKGKNGVSKKQLDQKDSMDDIVLARDGGFIGMASDF